MRLSIEHTTRYVYEEPVRYSAQYLRLVPSSNARQQVVEWRLDAPAPPSQFIDGYNNITHLLTINDPACEIVIRSAGTVETSSARRRQSRGICGVVPPPNGIGLRLARALGSRARPPAVQAWGDRHALDR